MSHCSDGQDDCQRPEARPSSSRHNLLIAGVTSAAGLFGAGVVAGTVQPDVAAALAALAMPVVTVLVHRPLTGAEGEGGRSSLDK